MSEPISPWDGTAELPSPDRQHTARIEEAFEIAMGAPTAGTLELSDGRQFAGCNVSLVWSDDSR